MGLAIPQVVTSDRASGAQVIDGSLKFDGPSNQHLTRTPSSSGNTKTWTVSFWTKLNDIVGYQYFASAGGTDTNSLSGNDFTLFQQDNGASTIYFQDYRSSTTKWAIDPTDVFRDPNGWYHFLIQLDTPNSTVKLYVNNRLITSGTTTNPSSNYEGYWNSNAKHRISDGTYGIGAQLSQFYNIDGQALGPESFGYTDPLTNTWRPKKFGGNFTQSTSQYTGGTALTWDSSPIGSKWTLSNSNKTATGSGSASYTGGNVWSNAINSNTTYAWTLDITNGDTTGGWYFTDSQSATATHPDELSGNTLGLRGGDSGAGTYGTFASTNGTSDGQDKITGLSSVSPNGTKKIDFVVYRPASGTGKVWVKANLDSTWIGGGNPSDTSSTASFILPDGTTYFAFIGYDTSSTTTLTFAGDGTITSSQGTNSFYLPMDGNSPIGDDKSGQGNNWTPVNFGGSVALDNPQVSGARPILNTDGGGNVARPGVFGSEENLFYTVTTANGSVYQFDITSGNNPSLSFIRGATYRFDYTSHSSHPLRFSSTNPDSSTSAYTDGTNTSVSNVITITVPHNAPNTLYYYCTAHASAMNGSISVTTDETKADPYAWKNVLALPLIDNGAGGTTQDFSNQINAGSTTKASTTTGSTNSTSAQSVFYGRSFILDGNGDDIRVPDTADFTFGSGDFTIEGWAHQTANSSWRSFVMKYTTNNASSSWFYGFLNGTQYFYFYHGASAGVFFASSDGTVSGTVKPISLNTWVHCAVTRSGNVFRMFENGVQVCTMTVNETNNDSSARLSIGQDADGNYDFAGYFSDVRVYKGVAKYTSDFVVPATSPDILPDTPSGVSGGSKLAKITDGAVSFDGSGDYLTAGQSEDYNFGTDSWTIECFAYFNNITSSQDITDFTNNASATGDPGGQLYFSSSASNGLTWYQSSTQYAKTTTTPIIPKKWLHIAVVKNSSGNTIKIYIDGKEEGSSSHSESAGTNAGALRIGLQGSTYFNGFLSNIRVLKGTALYTANFTPPTRELTNVTNTKLLCCQSNKAPGDATIAPLVSGVNSGTNWSAYLSGGGGFQASYPVTNAFNGVTTGANTSRSVDSQTTQTFTPPGGISYSSSVEVWTWMAGTVSLNGGSNIAVSNDQSFRQIASGSGTIDSISFTSASGNNVYIAGIKVDGTILVDPITPYGDPAATNFNPFTTDINAVRGQETGYATLNPLDLDSNASLSNGNLTISSTTNGWNGVRGTTEFPSSGGKWYFEVLYVSGTYFNVGIDVPADGAVGDLSGANSVILYEDNGTVRYNNQGSAGTISTTIDPGMTFGVAVNHDTKSIQFYIDNILTHSATYTTPKVPAVSGYGTWSGDINFGQKPFKFPPPEGFQPLNAANVRPETVITRPDHYVGITTWKGNGVTGLRTINADFKFKPDFVWEKVRTGTDSHILYDSVRGYGASKALKSNSTVAEGQNDNATYGYVNSVFNGGIEIFGGSSAASDSFTNENNQDMVAWCWRAGGSKNTFNVDDVGYASAAAAGLTGGDIAPVAASVGTKQGFSIIQYQGNGSRDQSIPHGLTQAPDFSIIKNMDGTANWTVFHRSVTTTNQKVFYLNTTAAVADYSNGSYTWWHQLPGASLFYIGDLSTAINNGTNDMISYHWHDVPGLQKFGSYIGNNSADGPLIELGFRPAIILVKSSTNSEHWAIWDTKRSTFNTADDILRPNDAAAELANYSSGEVDFLSNGFKLRGNWGATNGSSQTYIYAAWAEAPTFNLFGAQSNAR